MTARRRSSPTRGSVTIPNKTASVAKKTGRSVSTVPFASPCPGKGRMFSVCACSPPDGCWSLMRGRDLSPFKNSRNQSFIAAIISCGTWANWGAVISIPTKPGRVKYLTCVCCAVKTSTQPRDAGWLSASMMSMSGAGEGRVARSTWTSAASDGADKV